MSAVEPAHAPPVVDTRERDAGRSSSHRLSWLGRLKRPFKRIRVFVSYRRDDSSIDAELIHLKLAQRFGEDHVFLDTKDVNYGDDFKRRIDETIRVCDVLVAVIGPKWSELLARRLGRTDDYVRHEIASALARGIRVIPVLVRSATPTTAFEDVPPDLAPLKTRNALELKEREVGESITKLVEVVQGWKYTDKVREVVSNSRIWRGGLVTGLALSLAAGVALLDLLTLDTRFASLTMWLGGLGATTPWSGELMVVTIDGETEKQVGRKFDRTWRREHAQLVDRLSQAGARTIAFDISFDEAIAGTDEELARAFSRARQHNTAIVLPVDAMEDGTPRIAPALKKEVLGRTVDGREVQGWGIACTGEQLGYARSMPLVVERGERAEARMPSLALAAFIGLGSIEYTDGESLRVGVRMPALDDAATVGSSDVGFSYVDEVAGNQRGCSVIADKDEAALQLLHLSPPGFWLQSPRRLAYEEVLDGTRAETLASVKNKIVLVGLSKPDTDVVSVASGPMVGQRFGIELHADQLDAILRGDVVRSLDGLPRFFLMVAVGVAGAYAQRWGAPQRALVRRGALVGLAAVYLAAVIYVYRAHRLLLNVPYEIGAFALAYVVMRRLEKRGTR